MTRVVVFLLATFAACPQLEAQANPSPAGTTAPAATDNNAQRRSGDARPAQNEARGDDEATVGARQQLPQTSTILPLLGLIGLGSLVAGFFARR